MRGSNPIPEPRARGSRHSWGLLLILAPVFAACGSGGSSSPLRGWNVLLVTLDTTRADRLGCYGRESAETPNLDALAAAGVRFETAVAQVPVTTPSHASILTGTYPIYHGVRNNANYPLPEDNVTLAERFREAGYRTSAVVASRVLARSFRLDQGFDRYDDDVREEECGPGKKYRRGESVTRLALDTIRRDAGGPFFAWIHYYDPHAPYDPPEPYRSRHPHPYDGEIAYVDACVGDLLRGLDDLGLRDRTLVVVTSDHGEGLRDPHDEETHGILLYEETLRIPLLLAASGKIPAGRVVPGLVRSIDLAPTVLDLLGLPVPEAMQGDSLLPTILQGDPPAERTSYFDTVMPREAYGWSPMKGIRDARWKYIDAPKAELFDLAEDPRESRNVLETRPERTREMRARLAQIERRFGRESARASGRGDLDEDLLANLEALGYVVRSAPPVEGPHEAKDPKDYISVQNYLNLSDTLLARDRIPEAMTALDRALEIDPENVEVLRRQGVLLFEGGELDRAREKFLRITELAPLDFMGHFRLGQVDRDRAKRHEAAGDAEEAERCRAEAVLAYTQALAVEPEHALSLLDLANILARQGNTAKAIELYERSYRSNPDLFEPHFNRGVLLRQARRLPEAIAEFEWIVDHRPEKEWGPHRVKEMLEEMIAEANGR